MQYMIHHDFGIHNMPEHALDEAKAVGWVPLDIKAHLESKGKVAKEPEKPIIEAPAPKRGRPSKGTY